MSAQPVTRLDLFTVPAHAVPAALVRMATDRLSLRRERDLRFFKLLGTGDGRTFDVRDADLRRWALLTVWPSADHAHAFARRRGPLRAWRQLAIEHWWTTLTATRARGLWASAQPFIEPSSTGSAGTAGGPVAVVTRARLRWRHAPTFWRAVPAVNHDLAHRDGLLLRIGIGEAPIGLQGTFSLWRDSDAMLTFAYRALPHREVIRRSQDENWYSEELFARFAIVDHDGSVFGRDPLAE